MAHSLTARKRVRQDVKRCEINTARRSALKTQTRKFVDAVRHKDTATAEKEIPQLVKAIDQIEAKGTIHKNTANRRKSRMQKRLNALKTGA